MKKLIAIVIAMAALLALAAPVSAADLSKPVDTTATVGGGGAAPYMIALTMTPDEVNGATDGINILPEPAIPNASAPLFPNISTNATGDQNKDGWKRVNFYLMADLAILGHDSISGMTIDVYYPDGTRKFEINALKVGGVWTASQSGYAAVNYPPVAPGATPIAATPPAANGTFPAGWSVRELNIGDYVDNNADGVPGNDSDQKVQDFLTSWGTRVVYGPKDGGGFWDANSAGARLQSNQCLMLELQGWIWFHQSPVWYSVVGKASKGLSSPTLTNSFQFVPTPNLYLDFSNVDFSTFSSDIGEVLKQGDTDLTTAGSPTIWDNGNQDAQVSVASTKMLLNWDKVAYPDITKAPDYTNAGKTISQFDAALYYKDPSFNNVQVGYITYPADAAATLISNDMKDTTPVMELGTTGAVLLQACRPAKIDFSIFPISGIDNGVYSGKLTITIAAYAGTQPEVN